MRQPARMDGINSVWGFLWSCGSDPVLLPPRITIRHAVTRLLAGSLLFLATSAVHATAPIGVTPGSFAVDPSGAATYSIPIFVPPGTNGMLPQLSLNYHSQGGNGLLGMGWSIGGLSVIHRCGATIAIDGIKGGVKYDANDKFCLDGERLIWDTTTGFYRTQHESWQKVVAVGGTVSDPSYFTVTTKDGTVQYYGYDVDGNNSRIEAQGKSFARLWALSKIQDRNGNYLTITYQEDNANGDYRPASIAYTGNLNTSTSTYNTVYFEYLSRSDINPLYEGGSIIKITQRLDKIRVNAGASLAREYLFAYDYNGAMGRSQLRSIQECGSDEVCLPATNFDYQNSTYGSFTQAANFNITNTRLGHSYGTVGSLLGDFNGDGKADILRWHDTLEQNALFLSNGDGSFTQAANFNITNTRLGHSNGTVGSLLDDFNGDGKADILRWWDTYQSNAVFIDIQAGIPDQLISITGGLGAQISVIYKTLTDSTVYAPDTSSPYKCSGYPCQDVQNATYVVSQHSQSNGIGSSNIVNYQYGGLKTHHTAATSLGFRWVQTTDPAGITHVTYIKQTLDGTEGTVASSETWASGVRVKYAGNTWTPVILQTDGAGRVQRTLARLASSVEETRELNNSVVSTVNTSYLLYDSYGNPGSILVNFNDSWTKTTESTYDNDTVNWQLGKLTYAKVTATAPGQGLEYRESSFTYDSLGRVQTEVIEPNRSAFTLTTTYGYDSFGNRTSTTLSGPGIVSRTESETFTANGQFPLTRTNALGHAESFVYDARFGAIASQTGPNGLTTTWGYDGFGRKVVETRADGTATVINYKCWAGNEPVPPATCPAGEGYATETLASGSGAVWVYSDVLGRPVRTARIGYDGIWVYTDTIYDSLGRQTSVSQPDFNNPPVHHTTFTYDVLGRALTETKPGNRVITTSYNGLTATITNPKNQTHTSVKNSQGAAVSATDAIGGTISYVYDPFGNLKTVTGVDGAVNSMTYDVRGRKIAMNDPDMGAWSYVYNVLGELTSQTDAKGQTITMAYDKLGRMTSRVLPNGEGTSTWTYDTATKGIGKLASVSNPNASETYTYDSLGRLSTQTVSVSGITYTVTTAYDALGRIDKITYPETGFRLKHVYDANQFGFLKEVKNDSTGASYWKISAGGVDAFNRIINETYGNGLITQRQYAVDTGHLNFIKTGTAGNPTSVQNQTYGFDELGNITARSWWDGMATRSETFGYDTLNRLTTVTGPANKTYAYDPNGNITSKTSVGNYTYPTNGIRPHAVSSIAGTINTSFTYDANGNMLTGNGRTLTYTSFNKVKTAVKGGITDTFTYDAGFNRLIKSNGSGTTIYIGKLYERVTSGSTTTQKHYIYAGSYLVGAYTKTGASTNTRYFHTDHLGSVDTITNETGGVVQRLSYDAFGKRRNANGTDATSITAQTTRGFTRHEHDDEVGLVNMNAREYDPVLGRFTAPDTIVPQAINSQAYNRYSYVINNPLSFTDPSGHSWLSDFIDDVGDAIEDVADWGERVVEQAKQQVARSTSYTLQKVSGINYVGGLLSTGLLAGTHFGWVYGVSTGDWRTVGRAHATGAVLTFGAWAAPNLTALQWYGYPTYVGANMALGYTTGYSLARINGASSAEARAAGQDVAKFSFVVSSASILYNEVVGYDATWESGGEAKPKTSVTYPYEGANNFGTAERVIDPKAWFGEGGRISRALNAVPGINAIAGMHDVFQVELQNWGGVLARNIFNVPGMPAAAVLTTPALFEGPFGMAAYGCGYGGYCDPYQP